MPLLAVLNATAYPSAASVPIITLLYNGPLNCGFNVPIKGLIYCFLLEKVGGSEKNRLLNGVENGPADNVTCAVRNDHCLPEHRFRVLFATGQ